MIEPFVCCGDVAFVSVKFLNVGIKGYLLQLKIDAVYESHLSLTDHVYNTLLALVCRKLCAIVMQLSFHTAAPTI